MFGAASMGALRAAECAPYGFTPLGAIARWYVRGVIDGDDEVAVLTHPRTHVALTAALVNVRHVMRLATRAGILDRETAANLIDRARRTFYMDRTWEDLESAWPSSVRSDLRALVQGAGDLKRLDARFALRRVFRARGRAFSPSSACAQPASLAAVPATTPLRLATTVPKIPGTYDRAVPFVQTLALLPALRERYGITRVADTTYLDRTGIPTFSAMVPHSPDLLGVYNGKGLSREAAIASAVMEAAERQIGAEVRLPVVQQTMAKVREAIDVGACGARSVAELQLVDCVHGTDLLTGAVVPVPLAMVQCPYFGLKLFDVTTSNGLASGNNRTEATYHALCELIERHAWAIYHTRCSLAPRIFFGNDAEDQMLAPEIELPCGDDAVDDLVRRLRANGLIVRAFYLEEPPLPTTILATVTEPESSPPMAHMGMGCSLSPAHALTRAITEAVQSRVVDIQGAREDLLREGETAGIMGDHARRLAAIPTKQWYYRAAERHLALRDIEDRSTRDLARDLEVTIDALSRYGVGCVIVVDLSPPELPIAVVRAIVPGLETFMFTGYAGARLRAELNPFAVRPTATPA